MADTQGATLLEANLQTIRVMIETKLDMQMIGKIVRQERFALPYSESDIAKALMIGYDAEVIQRGCKIQNDNIGTKEIAETIAKWMIDPKEKPGLLLYGTVGTGKTTMLKAVCRVINSCLEAENDRDRLGTFGKEVISMIRAKDVLDAYQTNNEFYKKMMSVKFIAIDEIGVESIDVKSYGNVSEPLIDLLSTRYDKQKMTLVSSNLDLKQVSERYGLRLADRFNEMFKKIAFVGASYRGYANQKK